MDEHLPAHLQQHPLEQHLQQHPLEQHLQQHLQQHPLEQHLQQHPLDQHLQRHLQRHLEPQPELVNQCLRNQEGSVRPINQMLHLLLLADLMK